MSLSSRDLPLVEARSEAQNLTTVSRGTGRLGAFEPAFVPRPLETPLSDVAGFAYAAASHELQGRSRRRPSRIGDTRA